MRYSSICNSNKQLISFYQIQNTTKLCTFQPYRLIHIRRKESFTQSSYVPVFKALEKLPVNSPRGSRAMATTSKGFISANEKTNRQKMDEDQLLSLFQKALLISEAKAKETVANKKVSNLLLDIIKFVSSLLTSRQMLKKTKKNHWQVCTISLQRQLQRMQSLIMSTLQRPSKT